MGTLLLCYLICALAGTALALLRPPRLPRYSLLLAIAAVPQLGSLLGIRIMGMFLVSAAAFCAWCLCNRNIPGVLIVALGAMLNLLVMAAHGGAMPVRADVLAAAGYAAPSGAVVLGSKDIVVLASPLALLSDWLVFSYGARTIIASPGDLIAVAGILYWLLFGSANKERMPHDAVSRQPRAA